MKPLLLALDTTNQWGSLALVRGAETLEEVTVHAPDGFAQVIYGELRKLLSGRSIALTDIDCTAGIPL